MTMHNSEIAALFDKLANLLEIEGENPYRVRAYRDAARVIGGLPQSVADAYHEGQDLSELPSIGKDLAGKIGQVIETGQLPLLEEVEQRTPGSLNELMQIPQLGAKRIQMLYQELGVTNLQDLQRAVRDGRVRHLQGFGKKSEEALQNDIERLLGGEKRTRWVEAEEIVQSLLAYLRDVEGVKDVTAAGSYRRRQDTVGDLDILATCKQDSPVMERFVDYDEVSEVVSQGKTRSTVVLRSGMQVDLRVMPQVSFGAALHYFTGSKAHNIAVRQLALKNDLKINEYGVFKGEERIAGDSEKAVYAQVGLPYIEPELRENRGEIEAAQQDRLPKLIELKDIRGDLHCHTRESDGRATLEQMARAAAERGYEYLAITEHSQHLSVAQGLNKKRLLKQIKAIDRLNEKLDKLVVLKSIELDILEDGSLDLSDDVLKELDLTVCSVHDRFNLSRAKQTERVLRAMDNRHCHIIAHPTGRLINEREPYEIDLEKVMEGARERGCFLEINAQPKRLDLVDTAAKMAKEMGLKVAISTDAHSTTNLDYMRLGVYQARRGWLEADDVINTRSLGQLKRLLKRG